MGEFSAALKLADLNDFIAPSQACVVSLGRDKKIKTDDEDGMVYIQPAFNQIKKVSLQDPVKVTLHDCLACSGCITSAETVMLEQQSIGEFLSRLAAEEKSVVVSLSPQSRASLAAFYNLSQLQVFKKLTGFLKSLGVKAVFDTSCSRDVALIESCVEFVNRYKEQQHATPNQKLPILTSACPGWICYAEKTLEGSVLSHISKIKSPQQLMGAIIKRFACGRMGLRPEDVYHVTVMPCYDKKLEASRDDFLFSVEKEGSLLTEVDCVLTSGEILDLLQKKNVDLRMLPEVPLDRLLTNVDEENHLYGVSGGSGGYAECVFRYAAKELFGKDLSGPMIFRTLRNSDFRETVLEVEGKTVLRFACAYGFRNIQTIVRKLKSKKCEYDYVEIMACPSGCLNGGGQIKAIKGTSVKDLILSLESIYLSDVDVRDPFMNPIAKELYECWLRDEFRKDVMCTEYHHRDKSVSSELGNW